MSTHKVIIKFSFGPFSNYHGSTKIYKVDDFAYFL